MANSLSSQHSFCLFCYKTIEPSTEITKGSKLIEKFINLLNGYVKNTKINTLIVPVELVKKLSAVHNLLNCCDGCEDKVEQFCELYEQLKILEMRLDWKLGELVGEISYADILPTRWIYIDRILEDLFQDDLEKKCGTHNTITNLRQCVVNAGHQNKKQSLPRVLLQRNSKLDQEAFKPRQEAEENEETLSADENDDFRYCQLFKICQKCGKELKTLQGLHRHLEIHKDPSEWKFECAHCSKKVATKSQLKAHLRIHTGEKPYKCEFCGNKYRVRNGWAYHLKNAHGDEEGLEEELRKKWVIESKNIGTNLSDSDSTEFNNDVYMTEDANKLVDDLLTQLKAKPLDDDSLLFGDTSLPTLPSKNVFKCGKCEKTFQTRFTLETHLELHKNPNEWKWKCEKCGKKFATKKYLNDHLANHRSNWNAPAVQNEGGPNGRKKTRFRCPKCGKSFTRRYILTNHLEGHKDPSEWKWECGKCDKKFATRTNLNNHTIKYHPNGINGTKYHRTLEHGEKSDKVEGPKYTRQFACPICWKMFPSERQFKMHMNSHRDPREWKFGCTICGRKFSRRYSLKLHMRTHTKEQKYKCKYCGKRYRFVNSLGYHLRNVHRDQEEVKADIQRMEGNEMETKNLEEIDGLEVKEESREDVEEFEEIEICGNEAQVVDESERCNVNEMTNEMVVENENIFGDDRTFVDLQDIY